MLWVSCAARSVSQKVWPWYNIALRYNAATKAAPICFVKLFFVHIGLLAWSRIQDPRGRRTTRILITRFSVIREWLNARIPYSRKFSNGHSFCTHIPHTNLLIDEPLKKLLHRVRYSLNINLMIDTWWLILTYVVLLLDVLSLNIFSSSITTGGAIHAHWTFRIHGSLLKISSTQI